MREPTAAIRCSSNSITPVTYTTGEISVIVVSWVLRPMRWAKAGGRRTTPSAK
jgi:hypothetical protein